MNKTIDYYNKEGQAFYDRTVDSDLTSVYERFLPHLSEGASILDAGCGSGRDSSFFISKGYDVTAFDGSKKMVELASQKTGLDVMELTYQDMAFSEVFDAIWAQASLIHVPYEETKQVFQNMYCALKPEGVFCGSYKYGDDVMCVNERHFSNMTETMLRPYVEELFDVIDIWTEKDTRSRVAPSKNAMWLHFLARKKG